MKIAITGQGNVATHLAKGFVAAGAEICHIDSRKIEIPAVIPDVVLIAVADAAIAEVAAGLHEKGVVGETTMLAHTAGSVSMDVLKGYANHYGVLYPLQTFSKDVKLDYSKIPFFIEGESAETEDALFAVAGILSQRVVKADSAFRGRLHLAGVFACNFANHMWTIADKLLSKDGLGIEFLTPLIEETVAKLQRMKPKDAQTGPAARHDHSVIEKHLQALEGDDTARDIYRLLSKSIMER